MSYKVAVATSDGVHIDYSFGGAAQFLIYEVEGEHYILAETRTCGAEAPALVNVQGCAGNAARETGAACSTGGEEPVCKNSVQGGCGMECGQPGFAGADGKVSSIADCRCVVCKKIGFPVQKQLEKLAITGFDVECGVEEALQKIIKYLFRVDGHRSLRGIQKGK